MVHSIVVTNTKIYNIKMTSSKKFTKSKIHTQMLKSIFGHNFMTLNVLNLKFLFYTSSS
jgi:hypothetical protein